MTTSTNQVTISETCIQPSFSVELINFAGCVDPWDCQSGESPPTNGDGACDEVVLKLHDTSSSFFPEVVTGVSWEVKIYIGGILDEVRLATGNQPVFTFNDWHDGVRITVDQETRTCLGSNNALDEILKIDCFSPGDGSSLVGTSENNYPMSIQGTSSHLRIEDSYQEKRDLYYKIYTIEGKLTKEGRLRRAENTIPWRDHQSGLYIIQIFDKAMNIIDVQKILK